MACTFQELVVFVKDAGVAGRGGAGIAKSLQGATGVVEYVEVADAQVAPGGGEGGFQCNGAFPQDDRLSVAAAVIQQVTEIVGRMWIIGIRLDHLGQQNKFFKAAGKDAGGVGVPGAFASRRPFGRTADATQNVGLQIEERGLGAGSCAWVSGGEYRQRFVQEAGTYQVEGQIEQKLPVRRSHIGCDPATEGVQRIKSAGFLKKVCGLRGAAETVQHEGAKIARIQVVGFGAKGSIKMIQGSGPVAAGAVDFSQAVISGSAPGRGPRALIEGVISLLCTLLIGKRQAESVCGSPSGGLGLRM